MSDASSCRHPWPTSQWTLQELYQAVRPVIQHGRHEATWTDFIPALISFVRIATQERCDFLNWPIDQLEKLPVFALMQSNFVIYHRRDSIRETYLKFLQVELDDPGSVPQSVSASNLVENLLLISEMLEAKDPQDKLYGIYHMLGEVTPGLPKVDYDKEQALLYEEVTRHIITVTGSPSILILGAGMVKRPNANLPS